MNGYHATPIKAIMSAIIDGAQHIRTHVPIRCARSDSNARLLGFVDNGG